jgi:hypothetical protein
VEDILTRLPPMQHDPAFRLAHDPHSTALELDGLTEASRRHAEEYKLADRGGPSKMRAFAALADGLIQAYQHATKKQARAVARARAPYSTLSKRFCRQRAISASLIRASRCKFRPRTASANICIGTSVTTGGHNPPLNIRRVVPSK